VRRRALYFDGERRDGALREEALRGRLAEEAELWRERLAEAVAEEAEGLTETYLETGTLDEDDLRAGIREVTLAGKGTPVLCGSALKRVGIQPLLDAVCDYLPSPADVPPVKGEDPSHGGRVVERAPSPDEPLTALAFKVATGRHDELVYVRVYAGTLRTGRRVYNPRQNRKEPISRMYCMLANRREEQLTEAGPGEIVAVSGLSRSVTGDTLCEAGTPLLLEPMEFPPAVVSMAIEPRTQADRDKLTDSLGRLAREDPTFDVRNDAETGQLVVSGMGELHLEVIKQRLLDDFGVDANVGEPRVAYKETIGVGSEAEGRIAQQAGTRGTFAVVRLAVRPARLGGKVKFVNELPAHTIKRRFAAAIEHAADDTARGGVVTGYPLIDVEVVLLDAEEHPVDSNEAVFEAATSMAIRRAVEAGGAVLLEPIMSLEVVATGQYLGDIIADLNGRRAEIVHVEDRGDFRVVSARAPLSEMFGYATGLRSLTQGRGSYTLEPSDYQPAPRKISDQWVV